MPNHNYRIQRGRILKILYNAYDESVSNRVISLTLNDIRLSISDSILKGHCTYLQDRGLITIEPVEDMGIDFLAKLTPTGVDFVERGRPDDGIDLGV